MLETKESVVAVSVGEIKISTLTWNGKLMKMSMLKQVPLGDLVLFTPKAPQLAGKLLGWVNHAWKKDGTGCWPDLKTHHHIIWLSKEEQLRQCAVRKTWLDVPDLHLSSFAVKPLRVVDRDYCFIVEAAPRLSSNRAADCAEFWYSLLGVTRPEDKWNEPHFGHDSGPSLKYASLDDQKQQMLARARPIYDATAQALRSACALYTQHVRELEEMFSKLPQLYIG